MQRKQSCWTTGLWFGFWPEILCKLHASDQDILLLSLSDCCKQIDSQGRLQLVCQSAKAAFQPGTQPIQTLKLAPSFEMQSVPSLKLSLERCSQSVQTLAAFCDFPTTAAVLCNLKTTELARILVVGCSAPAMPLLSTCKFITTCRLVAPANPQTWLGIGALQHLRHLSKLVLEDGQYYCPCLPCYLTNLTCKSAEVHSEGQDQYSGVLKELSATDSQIQMSSGGIAVCHHLEVLDCNMSCFIAVDPAKLFSTLQQQFVQLPARATLSSLSCLKALSMGFIDAEPVDAHAFSRCLKALFVLTSLEKLDLHCHQHNATLVLPAGLTALRRLSCLSVSVSAGRFGPSCLELRVRWKIMHALRSLVLSTDSLHCTALLRGLSKLQC